MYPDSSENLNKETDEAIYFFTPAFAPLDNFSAHKIFIWNKNFITAEHAYQWKKFEKNNKKAAQEIFEAASPEIAKNIADECKSDIADNWHDIKVDIMKDILRAKAEQHKDVRKILKKTKQREIIENSPVDDFWGNGSKNNGQNILGKIWMEIRNNLIE